MIRVRFGAFIALLLLAAPAAGAPGSEFAPQRAEIGPAVVRLAAAAGPLSWIEGEVLEAAGERCRLACGGKEYALVLPAGCPVYANGGAACLAALRPVAPGACFWARVWFARSGEPVLVEAVYAGGELTILALSPAGLTGRISETGDAVTLAFAGGSPPPGLAPGQAIYVLLDLRGRIREVHRL